ncbi:MAG: sulfate adenylyltransferase [Alphaproteobacteria bacterium]|nr:sulfate adenylyltransferase [Alphaproteobacteria bacterium]
MTTLALDAAQYRELEKIAEGAFRPLDGFCTEAQFASIVDSLTLPDGAVFPLPVLLDVGEDTAKQAGSQLTLTFAGVPVGAVDVCSVFTIDKAATARRLFGTDDRAHPGVQRLSAGGDWFVGGPVRDFTPVPGVRPDWEMSPQETRAAFDQRGWRTVAGFQTRNVPHRAHEYLLRVALETVDGLLVHPLVGWKKTGDYTAQAIRHGYRTLLDEFFVRERVLLSAFSANMRYAGPREALFHALVRRNYGCTHFIIGRDHAGVGGYYGRYDAHDLVRRYEDRLGISILYLHGPFYCEICDGIVTDKTCPHRATVPDRILDISGTQVRDSLRNAGVMDARLIRPEIINSIRDVPVFME